MKLRQQNISANLFKEKHPPPMRFLYLLCCLVLELVMLNIVFLVLEAINNFSIFIGHNR